MSAKPLATYSERLLEVRRELELYDDRIVVRARWLPNRRLERVVRLGTLTGECRMVTVRYRMHRRAGWILAVGALALAICYYEARDAALGAVGYAALGVTILGVILVALTYRNRRIRFARFPTRAGPAGLDIGSAGNAKDAFEEFVERVRRQIRRCPPE